MAMGTLLGVVTYVFPLSMVIGGIKFYAIKTNK